jgi:hypothetical protein
MEQASQIQISLQLVARIIQGWFTLFWFIAFSLWTVHLSIIAFTTNKVGFPILLSTNPPFFFLAFCFCVCGGY